MWNPPEDYKRRILDWKKAAISDGWECTPSYASHEDESRACKLYRDGFVVRILTRDPLSDPKPYMPNKSEYDMCAWGPDSLALSLPQTYDFDNIKANLLLCGECKKHVDHVQRVAFCNRVCDACLSTARAKHEKPGWCD